MSYPEHWIVRAPFVLVEPYWAAEQSLSALRTLHWESQSLKDQLFASLRNCSTPDLKVDHVGQWARKFGSAVVRARDAVVEGNALLETVEEEFGAVADGIVEFHGSLATSVHRLVIDLASVETDVILETIGFITEEEHEDMDSQDRVDDLIKGFSLEDILPYIADAAKSDPDSFRSGADISPDDYGRLDVRLEQELFRAWKNKYPNDTVEFKTIKDVVGARDRTSRQENRQNHRLTPSEQHILDLIADTGKRQTTDEVLRGLRDRYGAASTGTTKQCLSGLVRRGLLTNRRDVDPKGYGLPEWG